MNFLRNTVCHTLILVLLIPSVLYAQDSAVVTDDEGDSAVVTGSGSSGGSVSLDNPLGDKDLMDLINEILGVLLVFAVPIIVFFIIFAGFKYVTAQGKPGEIETANRALLYAVIGGVLILGARVLMEVIGGTISAIAG